MSGHVNDGRGGWTELRVHGVSGTPPTDMLQHPQVARVAGDASAGFYRRSWQDAASCAAEDTDRLEAYSWGGLTAGSGQRALWLLLTPFLLVNVAYWAMPYHPRKQDPLGRRWVRRVAEAVLRLFALSITLTLVLTTIAASMNLLGWQCVRTTWSCSDRYSWLGFLDALRLPGRRLAVTALVPLALVALLWALARKTWADLESTPVEPAPSDGRETPLEDRGMWNGTAPVRKLRAVHVTAAIATIALFLLAPLVAPDAGGEVRLALAAVLALLLVAAVLSCLSTMTDRPTPSGLAQLTRLDGYGWLPWLALALTGWCLSLDLRAGAALAPATGARALPWFGRAVEGLFLAQAVLLLVMLGLVGAMARWGPAAAPVAGSPDRAGTPVTARPIWRGLGAVVLMLAALVLAGGFAAGLGLRVADFLGTPTAAPGPRHGFVLPYGYFWAAAATVVIAAVALVLLGIGLTAMRLAAGRAFTEHVRPAYPAADLVGDARRARQIAQEWARATVSSVGERLVGVLAVGAVVVMAAGVVGYLRDRQWVYLRLRPVVTLGTVLVGGFVLFTLYVGWQAYRHPAFRRTVGILWDLGTFWPRAVHPLAPPCYAERTVPDLIHRISYLGGEPDGGRVVLSCHSQGSVIGAAVVMQMTYAQSSRVALLTYGSPLRRLYARFFPAYFSAPALMRAGAVLLGGDGGTDAAARARWPWRNLYRRSDPIGGPILVDYPATEVLASQPVDDVTRGDNADVDRQLIDPAFARLAGDRTYPSTCGHSDYFTDRAFEVSAEVIRELRTAAIRS